MYKCELLTAGKGSVLKKACSGYTHETFNVKNLLRMSQSAMSRTIQCILISINCSYVYFTKLTKDSKNSNCATPDTKNH